MLWRAEGSPQDVLEQRRLKRVFEALESRGLETDAVLYSEGRVEQVRRQLLMLDGVLVWVDPISEGRDRSQLDPLLREVASQGVWVSTHPDTILKMGTKEVLVTTREMGWGTDAHLYRSKAEMEREIKARLGVGPRVLKQHRGNGGNGVWRVEARAGSGVVGRDSEVEVLHAQRGSSLETMRLGEFIDRCEVYFERSGCIIDQAYQERLGEGMVRCYLVGDRVAGFGHQFVTALLPPPSGTTQSPVPSPRLYYGPDKPEFQAIKMKLETEWVSEMQRILGITGRDLPALWDADFLLGPKDATGQDTHILGEINVSSVLPFPDEALGPLAEAVQRRLLSAG